MKYVTVSIGWYRFSMVGVIQLLFYVAVFYVGDI